jgi:hypothetical protein
LTDAPVRLSLIPFQADKRRRERKNLRIRASQASFSAGTIAAAAICRQLPKCGRLLAPDPFEVNTFR